MQEKEPTLDPHNVAWVDEDENDDEEDVENRRRFNVREVSFAAPVTTSTGGAGTNRAMPPPMFGGKRPERDVVDYDHTLKVRSLATVPCFL